MRVGSLISHPAVRASFVIAMIAGSLFISRESLAYLIEGELHPFVLEKESLTSEALFVIALQIHVVAAALSLPACLALISRRMLRRLPRAHRWLGRVTGVVVLFALVPSGGYLAMFAKGGVASTLGFLLSGAIVVVAMALAVHFARARDFAAHRRCTLHVLAQMSVAVTSRVMLVAFARTDVDPDLAYIIALWLPVIGSACVVERIVAPIWRNHETAHRPVPLVLDPVR